MAPLRTQWPKPNHYPRVTKLASLEAVNNLAPGLTTANAK